MNTQRVAPDPPKHLWYQYSLRHLLIAVAVFSIVLSCYVWFRRAVVEPRETSRQIWKTIDALANKRQSTLTAKQWEIAAGWTLNLTANSALESEADLKDLRRFQRELEDRTKGNVDMTTILWIWDQHAHLTPTGKKYQRFRQQMLDEMHWRPSPEGRNGDK